VAHTTLKTSYSALTDRLNRFPQGAPPSDLLFKILSMLFSEDEAGLVSLMPIRPFTAKKASRFAILNPVHTTNFIPVVDEETCNGCSKCVNVCPVEAMTLVSANNPNKPRMKIARLNDELCLGCGVCIRSCNKKDSLSLESRPKRILTPLNGTHRTVVMAIERGKLQNLIFDNQVLWSHRAMAGVLGVILKLPPIKQVLASKQLKSRYLETLINYIEH
jgi:ferredoxin